MSDPQHLDESDFLRLFVKHAAALQAFARVLLPTWDSVDEVLSPVENGGAFRGKIRVKMAAHM